ncbi:MAG: hypothetical protein HC834_06575 [Rhodospirillales bacterium]|nr:hypothetical protein [Rhodospirillales bacterium]
MSYQGVPNEILRQIRINILLEGLIREVRRRTRAAFFLHGDIALNLAALQNETHCRHPQGERRLSTQQLDELKRTAVST